MEERLVASIVLGAGRQPRRSIMGAAEQIASKDHCVGLVAQSVWALRSGAVPDLDCHAPSMRPDAASFAATRSRTVLRGDRHPCCNRKPQDLYVWLCPFSSTSGTGRRRCDPMIQSSGTGTPWLYGIHEMHVIGYIHSTGAVISARTSYSPVGSRQCGPF